MDSTTSQRHLLTVDTSSKANTIRANLAVGTVDQLACKHIEEKDQLGELAPALTRQSEIMAERSALQSEMMSRQLEILIQVRARLEAIE